MFWNFYIIVAMLTILKGDIMKLTLTKSCLYVIFAISLITGIGDLAGGAASIPGATATIAASVDNELRCLTVFWLAFGAFSFWVARNIRARNGFIPAIALVMLVSGAARLLSIVTTGMPPVILFVAMIIEIVISIIIYLGYKNARQAQTTP